MSDQNEETKSGEAPGVVSHRMILSPVKRGPYRIVRPIAHQDVHLVEGVVELGDEEAKTFGDSVEPFTS